MTRTELPVAVIGAGPVGLAAAAHLIDEGHTPVIFEAGDSAGASILKWGHVKLFSPWKYTTDEVASWMLEASGWQRPDGETYHTGAEFVERYLQPLAELPQIAPHLRLNTRVTAVTRQGRDKMKTLGREDEPFAIRFQTDDRTEDEILAKAVIDASGTFYSPNPLGSGGIPAIGEAEQTERITYGIPDVTGRDRERYAGKRVLVIGSGHSAFNVLLDLVRLKEDEPGTQITWAVRRSAGAVNYGGGEADQLPARGALGARMHDQVESGQIELVGGFQTARLSAADGGVLVHGENLTIGPVDEIVATTGFRPDLEMLRELRLDLDSIVESPSALAPLIDPNIHSCGSVPPHGARELRHPEADFYVVGMKSYGRAPTFLMLTGYEQVRSVVAAISDDWARAERVELVLPETGVCSSDASDAGCCGTSEPITIQIVSAANGAVTKTQPREPVAVGGGDCCS